MSRKILTDKALYPVGDIVQPGTSEGGRRTRGQQRQSEPQRPLVSIITVCFNARSHIKEAIRSVLDQTYSEIEYIVVDGSSTDGTIDILRDNDEAIDYWRSEPDKGIYHAMNKGIGLATGKIIGLVNADDAIYPDAVANVVSTLNRHPDAGFACAPVDLAREDGTVFGRMRPLTDDEVNTRMYREMVFPHQGMYVRREVYERYGGFDESYKLSADYDFLLRLLENSVPYVRITIPVGYFRQGGASGGRSTFAETRKILRRHGVPKWRVEYQLNLSLAKLSCRRLLPRRVFRFFKRFRNNSSSEWYY